MPFTEEQINALDDKNLENMLHYFEPEMRQIAAGENARSLLNKRIVRLFLNNGFLEPSRGNPHRGVKISQKGRELYNLPPKKMKMKKI